MKREGPRDRSGSVSVRERLGEWFPPLRRISSLLKRRSPSAIDRLPAEAFLEMLYKGSFDRVPDAGGREHSLQLLEGGTPRRVILQAFLDGEEFTNRLKDELGGAQPTAVEDDSFLRASYRALLRRDPEPAEFSRYVARLRGGLTRRLLLAELATSAEFGELYSSGPFPPVLTSLSIDFAIAADPQMLVLGGRAPLQAEPQSMRLVLADGTQASVSSVYWSDGQDPAPGHRRYCVTATISGGEPESGVPHLSCRVGDRGVRAAVLPRVIRDPFEGRRRMLGKFPDDVADTSAISQQIHPILERLSRRCEAEARVRRVIETGRAVADPSVSIVIPLYRRLDFVEHQLSHFASDPQIAASELIYVLDSPEQAEELERFAFQLSQLYELPLRIVILERNVGYALANNIGVKHARAPRLLLLNSDVIPDQPGWLGALSDFRASKPTAGAVGAKLLYKDGSIQHGGMQFSNQIESSGLWYNLHSFKGLPRDLPAANVPRAVPAVTGACLLIDRDLFEDLGGFCASYVQGDFEDSDLCVRAIEKGRENWYVPAAELYHLERQSYEESAVEEWAKNASRYNCWLQTHRLGDAIDRAMRRFGPEPG